jgi:hypothetical protein
MISSVIPSQGAARTRDPAGHAAPPRPGPGCPGQPVHRHTVSPRHGTDRDAQASSLPDASRRVRSIGRKTVRVLSALSAFRTTASDGIPRTGGHHSGGSQMANRAALGERLQTVHSPSAARPQQHHHPSSQCQGSLTTPPPPPLPTAKSPPGWATSFAPPDPRTAPRSVPPSPPPPRPADPPSRATSGCIPLTTTPPPHHHYHPQAPKPPHPPRPTRGVCPPTESLMSP